MAAVITTVILEAAIGVVYSLVLYGMGKFADSNDVGKPAEYNTIKMIVVAIFGGLLAGYAAYSGMQLTPDSLAVLFSTMTIGGFGVMFFADMIATFVANLIHPAGKVAKIGFTLKA